MAAEELTTTPTAGQGNWYPHPTKPDEQVNEEWLRQHRRREEFHKRTHGYLVEGGKCPQCDYVRPLSASTLALQAVAASNERVSEALREIAAAIRAARRKEG